MPKDEPADFSIVERDVAFQGRVWNIIRETFRFGTELLTREFVDHPGAVAVMALNEDGEVLLIRQYRHPVRSYLWEIPAGFIDLAGESKLAAAERELLEETGYRADRIEFLTEFFTTPGGNNETISIFLATGVEHVGHNLQLEGEELELEVRWVPLTEALGSVLRSEIKSPSAQVGIMALANQLGLRADV
jgi:ADP-ribose pyrophosphatase